MENAKIEITIKVPVPLNSKAWVLSRQHYYADFTPLEVLVGAYLVENGVTTARCVAGLNRIRYIPVADVYASEAEALAHAPELLKRYGGRKNADRKN